MMIKIIDDAVCFLLFLEPTAGRRMDARYILIKRLYLSRICTSNTALSDYDRDSADTIDHVAIRFHPCAGVRGDRIRYRERLEMKPCTALWTSTLIRSRVPDVIFIIREVIVCHHEVHHWYHN